MTVRTSRFTMALALLALAAFSLTAQRAAATTLTIQLSGLDLEYDGTDIFSTGGADPLLTVGILDDGALAGPIFSAPTDFIEADVFIPDVLSIPVAGGSVASATGGTFDLIMPGGDFLSLTLDVVTVQYLDVSGTFQFVFGGSAAAIAGQALPYGLEIGDPISVSFSTQVDPGSLTDDGTYVTGFTSSGTGEINGSVVPEPGALVVGLLGMGVLSLFCAHRRRRGGQPEGT